MEPNCSSAIIGDEEVSVVFATDPAQLDQAPDLAPHRLARQTGGGGDRVGVAGLEAAIRRARVARHRGRRGDRTGALAARDAVLQGADIMQCDLAEQDGEQDVAVEVFEPAPQAADLVAREHERDRLDRAACRRRIRVFRVRCWAHWAVMARFTLFC